MRGAHNIPIGAVPWNRIIPAYAGSTKAVLSRPPGYQDHPRVCGEHAGIEQRARLPSGSSPRMRGALAKWRVSHLHPGIIPAYAGSTLSTSLTCHPTEDHPRVCGEHRACALCLAFTIGSSPRMRGAHT